MFLTVILVMLTAFLALNLYRVLGKRTGHEQPLPKPVEERAPLTVVQRPVDAIADAVRAPAGRTVEPKAEAGLRAIIAMEPSFDVTRFLEGAQGAYRMILEAFWKGDEEQIAFLAEDEVRDAFTTAILARTSAGHVLDNRLLSIERATICDASLVGRLARITVRFDADIAAVTRDAEDRVIAGSLSDAVESHDLWTFARTLKSNDPNWKLADTDEA